MRLSILIFAALFFLLMEVAIYARPADPRLKYYSARREVICAHNPTGVCVKNKVSSKERESKRKAKLRPWL